ncbi:hypothetical protein ZIOFF_031450 [Zingiber officinale]|uniref:Golgi apparatus membrane protein TVP15 n=1 Tax=Zingiber officinale TaxID=94328 RepID=A0A8J5GLZ5_ZINOF|nr:hypothetical protein ZIOFF_031450 [Zingiber officinale]
MARDAEAGGEASRTPTLPTVRVRASTDPLLIVCRCFSFITAVAALLCVAVNALSAVRSFKNGSDIFGGIFRCYAIALALFVAVAETEWTFVIKFWSVNSGILGFVAVMTRAYSDATEERKDLLLLHEISSYLLLACGLTYVISGVLCIGFLKRARQHKKTTREQAARDLEEVLRRKDELEALLIVDGT